MQILHIRNINAHAFHGCLPQETKIGSRFSVDLSFEGDFSSAMESDQLVHAVDYVLVHAIVREEMAIPSALIEHVAARILKRLKVQFPNVVHCTVALTKYNPPVNGQLGEAVFVVKG
ncbi:MAG: dihydroneopterin aldolase [Bacteroidia bacterium]|jgi:dihydroneopterin aldolase|nr:dihydroneopterin aldolase [Bacteroidia bacterium]